MAPLDVLASVSPLTPERRIPPLDVRKRTVPSTSSMRRWPLEVVIGSSLTLRGTRTVNRAPPFRWKPEDRLARIVTELEDVLASIFISSSPNLVLADLVPFTSTESLSHPDTSMAPLKVSTETVPPGCNG